MQASLPSTPFSMKPLYVWEVSRGQTHSVLILTPKPLIVQMRKLIPPGSSWAIATCNAISALCNKALTASRG